MSFTRKLEIFLFLAAFVTYGWFNQGGGWNQNARFAEVRAIVDGGELKIDNYFCYQHAPGGALRRYPVLNGDVTIDGKTSRLCWVTTHGDLLAVNGVEPPASMEGVALNDLASSGDVAFARGHFHPNKPPGLSFLATPAYFLISHVERWFGVDRDQWWPLTVNAWLTSLFSVGLVSAGGVVLAFRIARHFVEGRLWPAFWTAVAFGFGTLFLPFATLLFDHDVTAVMLMAAFYCLLTAGRQGRGDARIFLAGLAAGMAAITNYVAAVSVLLFGLYLLATRRPGPLRPAALYVLGLMGPFLGICAYNQACFGSPFALANHFQNPAFMEGRPLFLGMFGVPDPFVALILLISPFRGIFYGAPILLMGLYGLWRMRQSFRAEMWLICGVALNFFLVNASFLAWHGGFTSGPRYLIPATAFLVLPAVYGFRRLPGLSGALLAVSVVINFFFTVTDVLSPAGVGDLAMANNRQMFLYNPLTEYSIPLFFEGRAWPLLNMMINDRIGEQEDQLTSQGVPPEEQKPILRKFDATLRQSILAGSDDPLELGGYIGPVSVNPTGICEGGYFDLFVAGSPEARWNSFNVGEFWFPESRLSLLPLLVLLGVLTGVLMWDLARARQSRGAVPLYGEVLPSDEIAID